MYKTTSIQLLISSILALISVSTPTIAQDLHHHELSKQIESIIDRNQLGRYWGTVLVRIGDETILSKGYGIENNDLSLIDPDISLFDIGSISKSFTACAILQLIESEQLTLSTTLSEIFPDQTGTLSNITIEQLLNHQSGIGSAERNLNRAGHLESINHLLSALDTVPLSPGVFEYSNPGYFLLAAIVESITGIPFEESIKELVFENAQLNSIGFINDLEIKDTRSTARVTMTRSGSISTSPLQKYPWNWGQRGATGVLSTTNTIADWFESIDSGSFLSPESKNNMLTPNPEGYGFGLYVDLDDSDKITRFWHSGQTRGFRSFAARYPNAFDEKGVTLVFMTQSAINLQSITNKVHKLISPPPSRPIFAGLYLNNLDEFEDDGIYTIKKGLTWKGMTQYNGSSNGKPIIDNRPTLVLENRVLGMWTLIARMDVEVAQNLITDLESVSNEIANDPTGATTLWSKGTTLIVNTNDHTLNKHNAIIIEKGPQLSVHASSDHFVVLTLKTQSAQNELAQIKMGGAEVRQLQAQIRASLQ